MPAVVKCIIITLLIAVLALVVIGIAVVLTGSDDKKQYYGNQTLGERTNPSTGIPTNESSSNSDSGGNRDPEPEPESEPETESFRGRDREIRNSDLDELAPGWNVRDEKSQRTVDDGDKKMDISMLILSIN